MAQPAEPDPGAPIAARLAELRAAGLERRLRVVAGAQGPRVLLDGAEVLLLCSNDYLGFAAHPRVCEAAARAAELYGAGAGASRLISGTMELHRKLERRLAEFEGSEAALLFGSGYLANTGVVSALAGRGDVVFSDELNHASIIDGCRLSRADTFVYRHRDTEHLAWGLARAGDRARLIVTDSVFSMDGDIAPLAELHGLARRHGCLLAVDEAHATGALGPGGRGAVAAAGLDGELDVVVVGTLGKALGSYGAYVCAAAPTVELLINAARPFIYSTAPPPPAVGAALASLSLLVARPGVVEALRRNAALLREELAQRGLDTGASKTQILPLEVGEPKRAVALCERLLERGVFAQAIRPPTVPAGSSRLRFAVMATHRADELRFAADAVAAAAAAAGVAVSADAAAPRAAARIASGARLRRAA